MLNEQDHVPIATWIGIVNWLIASLIPSRGDTSTVGFVVFTVEQFIPNIQNTIFYLLLES